MLFRSYNGKLEEENAINVTLEGGMKREAPKFVGGMNTAIDNPEL